jgi:hypothetical protein
MTERRRRPDDDELGRALTATGRAIEWPAAPDLAGRVSRQLHDLEHQPPLARLRLSFPRRRRTVLLVVAGVLLLAAAAVAAKVVIDLGAVTIDTAPGRPTALPSAVASGPALGHPASLGDAQTQAGFVAHLPEALGAPDAVWVDRTADGARIVLAWEPTEALPTIEDVPWGAVLYEFAGDAAQASKILFEEGDTLRNAQVDGHDAWWVTGEHELDMVTGDGSYARYRVTGNVLLWQTGSTVLRLEISLDRTAAVRIAESVPD